MKSGKVALTVLLAAVFACSAFAQDEEPHELTRLKEVFEKRLEQVTDPIYNEYSRNLKSLETLLMRRGDHEAVAAIREEMKRMADRKKQESTTNNRRARKIELDPIDAELDGSMQLNGSMLASWTSLNSSAKWAVDGIAPGNYHVYVDYSAPNNAGGTIAVQVNGEAVACGVGPTGSSDNFISKRVGTIQVTDPKAIVTLSGLRLKGTSLCNIRSIDLRPEVMSGSPKKDKNMKLVYELPCFTSR